jgi:uncharacterized membrane protein YbhN (UPF0104 family)
MIAVSRKAKQYLVLLIKLLVVGGAFYFVYNRIADNDQLDWMQFVSTLEQKKPFGIIFLILLLTFLNRFLEILKWQNLAGYIRPLSLWQSTEQVLAAVTAAIFTPNGIGEYAAKALYFKKTEAKTVIFLNLICNGIQLIIAVVAGLTGLLAFNIMYDVVPNRTLLIIIASLTGLALLIFSSRKITIKGYSLNTLAEKINEIPRVIHRKNNLLALLRYLSIIHQHYFIFLAFDVQLPYFVMITAIAAVYFVGSSLPNFTFLDFAVRGSVAVYFFGILGVNEWIVVFAATLQWLLNIVLPVSIGSYFVLRFKSVRQEEKATTPH